MSDEWVMVPREPTVQSLLDMAITYDHSYGLLTNDARENVVRHMRQLYDAAIRSAPAAPQQADEITRLRAEVEALRADAPDAARFRWLRDNTTNESLPFPAEDGRWIVQFFPSAGGIRERYYETLGAAVDAARAAQGGEHG